MNKVRAHHVLHWQPNYLSHFAQKGLSVACEWQTFFLAHHRWRMFHEEERLQLSDKNSKLKTSINVYIINPVVIGFQIEICSIFRFLLVDFGKVLYLSVNELQQNSNASSREDYIPQILTVLLEIHHIYIWPLWPFVFCLSFVNNS